MNAGDTTVRHASGDYLRKVEADSRFSLYHLRAVDAAINVATDVRNFAETGERAIKQFLVRLAESGGVRAASG